MRVMVQGSFDFATFFASEESRSAQDDRAKRKAEARIGSAQDDSGERKTIRFSDS
jgi:hypothetical protein